MEIGSRSALEVADAAERNAAAIGLVAPRMDGGAGAVEDDAGWYLTGIPAPPFNAITAARFSPESADRRITELLAPFRERSVPTSWWVGPASTPEDLGDRLVAAGFFVADRVPVMGLDLTRLATAQEGSATSRIEVVRVQDADQLADAAEVTAEGFETPAFIFDRFAELIDLDPASPVRQYLVTLDGEPAGGALIFLHGGVAGVYNVATKPSARRRGVGRAATLAGLRDAHRDGASLAVLASSDAGYAVYERLGFREVGTMVIYARVDWTD